MDHNDHHEASGQARFAPDTGRSERDVESYRRQYQEQEQNEFDAMAVGSRSGSQRETQPRRAEVPQPSSTRDLEPSSSPYNFAPSSSQKQHDVHIGNINDIIARNLEFNFRGTAAGGPAYFDFQESFNAREKHDNMIASAIAEGLLDEVMSNIAHTTARECLTSESPLFQNQREMSKLQNTTYNSNQYTNKYSNEEYSSFFKAARVTMQNKQYEEYKDIESQSSATESQRAQMVAAASQARARNASPSEIRYSSIDNGRQRASAKPQGMRMTTDGINSAIKIERLPQGGQTSDGPGSGNISSNSSDAQPTPMSQPMHILAGGLRAQIAMNSNSLRGVQASPSKHSMACYQQEDEEEDQPTNSFVQSQYEELPEQEQQHAYKPSSPKKYIDNAAITSGDWHFANRDFNYPEARYPSQPQNILQQHPGQFNDAPFEVRSSRLNPAERGATKQITAAGNSARQQLPAEQRQPLMDMAYKTKPPQHQSAVLQHGNLSPSDKSNFQTQMNFNLNLNISQRSPLTQIQNSVTRQISQLFSPKQEPRLEEDQARADKGRIRNDDASGDHKAAKNPIPTRASYVDTEALHDTVDVLCQDCRQLIPFNEVNIHSQECIRASNQKMISALNFDRQIKEINDSVAKIQEAVQKRVFQLDSQLDSSKRSTYEKSIGDLAFQKGDHDQIHTEISDIFGGDHQALYIAGHNKSQLMAGSPERRRNDLMMSHEEMIEYFIDEFSNLHAICDSILANDDDWEKLQLLLNILNDDYFQKINPLSEQRGVFKEKEDQLLIFARRLEQEITQKLIVFEEYAEQQQDLINQSNVQAMDSHQQLNDCDIDSADNELMLQENGLRLGRHRVLQSDLDDGDQLHHEITPRDLMNQSIAQNSEVKSSAIGDGINFDELHDFRKYEHRLENHQGFSSKGRATTEQPNFAKPAPPQVNSESEHSLNLDENYADPKFNHEDAMRANHRPGNEIADEQMPQEEQAAEVYLSFRNQEKVEHRSSNISFSKPDTTNTKTAKANPYATLDKQGFMPLWEQSALLPKDPSIVTFANGSTGALVEKKIQHQNDTFARNTRRSNNEASTKNKDETEQFDFNENSEQYQDGKQEADDDKESLAGLMFSLEQTEFQQKEEMSLQFKPNKIQTSKLSNTPVKNIDNNEMEFQEDSLSFEALDEQRTTEFKQGASPQRLGQQWVQAQRRTQVEPSSGSKSHHQVQSHRSKSQIQATPSPNKKLNVEKQLTSTSKSPLKRRSQHGIMAGLGMSSKTVNKKSQRRQTGNQTALVQNQRRFTSQILNDSKVSRRHLNGRAYPSQSNRNSQFDVNSNQNCRSQFKDDANYRLFKQSSSDEESGDLQQNVSIDQSMELHVLSESISSASRIEYAARSSKLQVSRQKRYVKQVFKILKDHVLPGRASKAVAKELIQRRRLTMQMKCMRQIKLNGQRQYIMRMMLGKMESRSVSDVFNGLRTHATNSKRYRAMKFQEAVQVYNQKIFKVALRGLDIWRKTMQIQKAEAAAERAFQAEQEEQRRQAELERIRMEAARIEKLRKLQETKDQFNTASMQIVELLIDDNLDQFVRVIAHEQIKDQTKLKLKHQKLETMAIDKLAEDMFEQIQRNMLIDVIYRSRREIEDMNKEIQDNIAQEIAESAFEATLQEQVAEVANSSLALVHYEQEVTDGAGMEIVDELCDELTASQVKVIVFELKMAEKLDKSLLQHHKNVNEIWTTLINELISSTVEEAYAGETYTHICAEVGQGISQTVIQSGLQQIAEEAIKQEHEGAEIARQLGEEFLKSVVGKVALEAYRAESAHQAACSAVSEAIQDEVMTQMLDEIIDEQQNEVVANRSVTKRALALFNKDLVYQVVEQDIRGIVENELASEHAVQQVVGQIVESGVADAVLDLCQHELANQKVISGALQEVEADILDQVVKEMLIDVVKVAYMEKKKARMQTQSAIGEIGDELIEQVVASSVEALAKNQCDHHNAEVDVASSMLTQQVLLAVEDVAHSQIAHLKLQEDVAQDIFEALLTKISTTTINEQQQEMKEEEQARLERQIEALEKLASDKALSEGRQRDQEKLEQMLNISFSEQNKEEFIKNIIEEVEEEKEDEPIKPEDIRSNRIRRKNLFGKKKDDDQSSTGFSVGGVSGLADIYGALPKNEGSQRRSFLPSNKRVGSQASQPSVSPRREPDQLHLENQNRSSTVGRSKRITINDISQAAAERFSSLGKGAKDEHMHSARSPAVVKTDQLEPYAGGGQAAEEGPARQHVPAASSQTAPKVKKPELETEEEQIDSSSQKRSSPNRGIKVKQDPAVDGYNSPIQQPQTGTMNEISAKSQVEQSHADEVRAIPRKSKRIDFNQVAAAAQAPPEEVQMKFASEKKPGAGGLDTFLEQAQPLNKSLNQSMRSSNNGSPKGSEASGQRRTFKQFLSDKKSPEKIQNIISPTKPATTSQSSGNQLSAQPRQPDSSQQAPQLTDQKNAPTAHRTASKSPRPSRDELFKATKANLARYRAKHQPQAATKSETGDAAASSKSPLRKKNLFSKRDKS